MPTDDAGHYGCIRHSQSVDAAHPQLGVDDGARIRSHPRGPDRVVQRLRVPVDGERDALVDAEIIGALGHEVVRRGDRPHFASLQDAVDDAEPGGERGPVETARVAQVARIDQGSGKGVGCVNLDHPRTDRLQQNRAEGQRMARRRGQSFIGEGDRCEDQLDVREGECRVGADEPVGFGDVGGQHPPPPQQVVEHLRDAACAEEGVAVCLDDEPGEQMVAQIRADFG